MKLESDYREEKEMSKPEMNVALVCGPDCDRDTQAIRATLDILV